MYQIRYACQTQANDIANFQCNMALQTENMKLNKQLVQQAVHYIVKHPQYGQYFIAVQQQYPDKACSSLLITYQNTQSWWIQSVYVKQQHRRKGVFTSMFKAAVQKGKQKGAKKIQLYVQKQNKYAKKTYQNLGMFFNGNQFYGYQLVYGDTQVIKNLSQKITNNIQIFSQQQAIQNILDLSNLKHITGQKCAINRKTWICEQKQLIGYFEYFYQFSDWRFGVIIYISTFFAKDGKQKISADSLLKYVYQNGPLKVGAIRIILVQNQLKFMKDINPSMHRDVYDVMQLNL